MSLRLLAIDPSSTRSGYAVMVPDDARSVARLVECGLLAPKKATARPIERIDDLRADVFALVCTVKPAVVVIEVPTHYVSRGRTGAGLTIYGMAVGAAHAAARFAADALFARDGIDRRVITFDERDWTQGRPKPERARFIVVEFPQYDPAKDPGGDMADAIGLGLFYLRTRATGARIADG